MNLTRLAWANLWISPLSSLLILGLLALSTASIVLLLLVSQQINDRLTRNARGIDLVLGAKGSPVQLVLSAVYHADVPTGNITLEEALRWAKDRRIARAVPIALGDSYRGHRIVGTRQEYDELFAAQLAQGRRWQAPFEAVLGADVARASGLWLGDRFHGAHGLGGHGAQHAEQAYRVVGVLAPTGAVLDQLILTDLESVWLAHGQHGDEADEHDHAKQHGHSEPHANHERSDDHGHGGYHAHEPAEPDSREITALLIQYAAPTAAVSLPRQINAESDLQAAAPAYELARLLRLIGVGLDGLRAFAAVLLISAAFSLLVGLYSALHARRGELAMMRCLGATRADLVKSLLLEGWLLAAAGGLLGLLLGHAVVEMLGQMLGAGLPLTGFLLLPEEVWLLIGLLAVAAVAAALPAWQAYRMDVTRALGASS